MNDYPLVSVNLVVKDGEKYIRRCLQSVSRQSYPNLEVIIFDNDSKDQTRTIVKKEFPEFRLIENGRNYYPGGGFNRCFVQSGGKYILALCVDVILDENFIKNAADAMEKDEKIGALQSKTLLYDIEKQAMTDIIDTAGFQIFRSRRIINRGHGEKDAGQFESPEEIFSYEGAAGFFRQKALKDAEINGEVFDEDFIWYADDIDLGWRIALLGWKNFYEPRAVAWHARSTTKRLSKGYGDFIAGRKKLPAAKKRWDYANQRLAMVKNETLSGFLKGFPFFIFRELKLWAYFLFFEQSSLLAFGDIIKMLPKMLAKRKKIMAKRRISAEEMQKWFK
jgi:GT2 family glycosyltransferase